MAQQNDFDSPLEQNGSALLPPLDGRHSLDDHDNHSIYWSARSILTRLFSDSTGFRSFPGATWREELIRNMNSGFGQGAPTNEYRAVQEGWEVRDFCRYPGVWGGSGEDRLVYRRGWLML